MAIEKIQEADAFEGLGEIVLSIPGKLKEFQAKFRQADGYGPHFAHYDGEEHECTANGNDYHIFRIN